MRYRYNPYCSCGRCRAHGYMGPAVLITIGVLFLIDQIGHANWMEFGFSWPALLIVIGVVLALQHSASAAGHVPREYNVMPPAPGQPIVPGGPGYPPQPPVVTHPPTPPAPGANWNNPNDPGVRNG